jgi:hypothetical protein
LRPVGKPDVVHPQKPPFENIVSKAVDSIDPPREVEEEFMKTPL